MRPESARPQKEVETEGRVFNNPPSVERQNMFGAEIHFIPVLAAAADLESSAWAKILFQITGFAIVLIALATLWASVSLIGAIFSRFQVEDPPAPPAASPAAVQAPIAAEHIAAITAALHTVLQMPVRIASIEEAPTNRPASVDKT